MGLHLHIHAVEASQNPERAVVSGERLGRVVPGAGHLVHMPSHIFFRVGRYQDAVSANLRAIEVDEDYITQCRAQGIYPAAYYPHNVHFLWIAHSYLGQSAPALDAARKTAAAAHHPMPSATARAPRPPAGDRQRRILLRHCLRPRNRRSERSDRGDAPGTAP